MEVCEFEFFEIRMILNEITEFHFEISVQLVLQHWLNLGCNQADREAHMALWAVAEMDLSAGLLSIPIPPKTEFVRPVRPAAKRGGHRGRG